MSESRLPAIFADLEAFINWARPTIEERWRYRLQSSMADIKIFYDAMLPKMEEVVDYLNQRDLDAMSIPDANLLYLAAAYMEASLSVEFFLAPDEEDVFPASRVSVSRSREIVPLSVD